MAKQDLFTWDPQHTPPELHQPLRALAKAYPIREAGSGTSVLFQPGAAKGCVSVENAPSQITIRYDKPSHALRGLGSALSGLPGRGKRLDECVPFETFGIMLDCSRNAVIKVDAFKHWLRQLALLGYNMAMLYTEDTYQLPGEEYFGYLRGRYTQNELIEIDAYAASLGIEMIGCIQTLGHLEQILRWPAYNNVRDTGSVMMAGNDATYELVDKMVSHWAKTYRSRRLHVGMDETHDLGRGLFLDSFGHQKQFDIFNRHLGRIVEICKKHGLSPMIWSDMYFHVASATIGPYNNDANIAPEIAAKIPPEAQLVYWDYYHDSAAHYTDWIERHRATGHEPVMGSGVWTWRSLWYDRTLTEKNAKPCVLASRQAGLKEFIFTMWGDDGGYCEFDSSLAGLAFGAEVAYVGEDFPQRSLQRRYAAICGADYNAVLAASDLNIPHPDTLWDDPILGIVYKDQKLRDPKVWTKAIKTYKTILRTLRPFAKQTSGVDFAHASALAEELLVKTELAVDLDKAYANRDKAALANVRKRIPGMIKKIDALLASFRRQWYRRNKPEGFEAIQNRLGGLKQRYIELSQRLADLATGRISAIPELEEKPTKPCPMWMYGKIASGSVIR